MNAVEIENGINNGLITQTSQLGLNIIWSNMIGCEMMKDFGSSKWILKNIKVEQRFEDAFR